MKTTIKANFPALITTVLTGIHFMAFLPLALAADFTGSLKGVTITDSQASNTPPIAVFTYSVSGNTVTFDASGSSDPDGTINEYKWSFGDGSFGSGQQASHTYTVINNNNVTLTLIDNSGGISLLHEIISEECTNEIPLFSLVGARQNNLSIYSPTRVISGRFVGNGKKITNITFKSGTDNGVANTISVFINSSQNFSGTTLAKSNATTPGTSETSFTSTFENGPVVATGATYYWAISDDNINWGNRFSLSLVSDSSRNYYLTDNGLEGPLVQNVNALGIWVEVKTCDN